MFRETLNVEVNSTDSEETLSSNPTQLTSISVTLSKLLN